MLATAAGLSVAVALIYAYVCYYMVAPDGPVFSDVHTQIRYMETWYDTGALPDMCQAYPLFYYLVRFLYSLMHDWTPVMMSFCLVWAWLSNFLQIVLIRKLCGPGSERYSIIAGSALSFVWPISLKYSFLTGSSYGDMLLERVLLTSGSANPTQSLTYLLAKPFALVALCAFIYILDDAYGQRIAGAVLIFAASLFMSVIAKPCFYQTFAPAGVIVTVVWFLRRRDRGSFIRALTIAAGYLPATAWVLYAMSYKLSPYEVALFEGIRMFGDGTPIPIVLIRAVVFCLAVCICVIVFRRIDPGLITGALTWLFGVGEFLLLIEVEHPEWLSMGWGLYISIYAFFATAIIALYRMRSAVCDGAGPSDDRRHAVTRVMYPACNVLLAVHASFGLAVFIINVLPWWIGKLGI